MMTFYSTHLKQRASQRNLREDEIDFIIQHGNRVRRTGVIFCQMLDKTMPDDLEGNHPYRRLAGTTVVLCGCGELVVTVYRDEKAYKKDRRKPKYNNRKFAVEGCPNCCGDHHHSFSRVH